MAEWIKHRYEGPDTVIDCGFCGQELDRYQSMLVIESPDATGSRFDAMVKRHLNESHDEELNRDVEKSWSDAAQQIKGELGKWFPRLRNS